VINWGPPNLFLLQDSDQGGRNGNAAEAILYYRNPGKNVTKECNIMGKTKACVREFYYLKISFLVKHNLLLLPLKAGPNIFITVVTNNSKSH